MSGAASGDAMSRSNAEPTMIQGTLIGHHTVASSFEVTARRIQAYAAAVRDTNPRYFDDLRDGGLIGHPAMAFSFQWNSRARPDRPPASRSVAGVHAWTDLRLERPFREGDVITSQGEAVGVEQVPPGVLSVDRYRMTDAGGAVVAELDMGGIALGGTLEGEATPATAPQLPEVETASEPLWVEEIPVPGDAAQIYTECARIYNPIHTERRVALDAGLPDIILHGSATQAMAISTIVDRVLDGDPARVRRFYAQNRAMVPMDTTIAVRCLGVSTLADGSCAIRFDVLTADGARALDRGLLVADPD